MRLLNRMMTKAITAAALAGLMTLSAQEPKGRHPPPAYPDRPIADSAIVARGKALYATNCSFCHGEDARGGEENGPNLIRSDVLLRDQKGELLASILQNGRGAMPRFNLTSEQVTNVAAFIHSFGINSRDPARKRPPSIVVGNAASGAAFFNSTCAKCHSASGDLKGIASRIGDPRTLQQTWLMPRIDGGRGGAPNKIAPITVTVTLADGKKAEGRLNRIDDFMISLTNADGAIETFRLDGVTAEVHDPLKPHKDLLAVYKDQNIHDVTAYLVTLK
jgi:cytochrome c oxidase cbb3-type subunit 3